MTNIHQFHFRPILVAFVSDEMMFYSQQGLSTGGDNNIQFWLCPSPPGPLHLLLRLPQSHSTLRKAAVLSIYECLLYERLVVRGTRHRLP
jgi:hypothetical protein